MRHFIAVVHKDAESCFGVHFPDVPGCFSAGETVDEAVANATEALSLHLEGEAVPDAHSLEAIRQDPDIAGNIAEGALLIAVPFIENDSRTVRANITMEAGLLRAVDEAAKRRGITRSAFLAGAARREIVG